MENGEIKVLSGQHNGRLQQLARLSVASSPVASRLGVLIPGAWYPHQPPVLVVIELERMENEEIEVLSEQQHNGMLQQLASLSLASTSPPSVGGDRAPADGEWRN